MAPLFVLASDIRPANTRNAIRLRLVRTYEVPERRGSNAMKSKECVFHDEVGTFLHAHIPKEHVAKYRSVFEEGKVYAIKNFLAITNFMPYKTSSHRFIMKFKYDTIVKESRCITFPRNMFRLKPFEELTPDAGVNDRELIDVIGQVVEIYSPLNKVVAGKPSKLIDFLIEDAKNIRLKCTVWDEHVSAVLPYFNGDCDGPLIVLLQLCRAKIVDNEIRISSSYDATQLWFNYNSPEFEEFKNKLQGDDTPVKKITSASHQSNVTAVGDFTNGSIVLSTIADLYEKKLAGDFFVPGTIVGIESVGDWFYSSCMSRGCNKKLTQKNGNGYCTKCDRYWSKGNVKYRLVVRVVDKISDAPFLI